MNSNIRLKVEYFAQNDNDRWAESDGHEVEGNVQCAATSNSMLLNYLKPDLLAKSKASGFTEFESYYKARFNSLGYSADNRGHHDCHTATLRSFGVHTQWRTNLTDSDITHALFKNLPVVVGFIYGDAGHICVIVGRTSEGYLVHDPYGIRLGASDEYISINPGYGDQSGAFDLYRWDTLEAILFDNDGKRTGAWGRVAA
jgi:hypothetical protein